MGYGALLCCAALCRQTHFVWRPAGVSAGMRAAGTGQGLLPVLLRLTTASCSSTRSVWGLLQDELYWGAIPTQGCA